MKLVTLAPDASAFRVSFPYDAALVAAVKDAVPYKLRSFVKENRGGHWLVNAAAFAELAQFAADHEFAVEDAAADKLRALATTPAAPTVVLPQITARLLQGEIVTFHIRTPGYSPEVNEAIKSAGGARWNGEGKYWDVPFSRAAISAVEQLASSFGLTIAPDLAASVNAKLAALDNVILLSSAHDADIQIPAPEGLAYLGYQKAGIAYAAQKGSCIIGDEPGLGKAQPLTALVLTPSGWKCMGDICVGDGVIGADGHTHTVTGVFPQGVKEVFRVKFSDGSETECCDEHLWAVQNTTRKWRDGSFRVKQLSEIRSRLFDNTGKARHRIPIVKPVRFETKDLPLDPYVLGALLGDGSLHGSNIMFTSADEEIVQEVERLLPVVQLRLIKMGGHEYDYRLNGNCNPVRRYLNEAGLRVLSYDKFIPEEYLFGDLDQRVSLLQGLMDTDGSVHSDGSIVEFCSTSERLCDGVRFIVQSLGGRAAKASRITNYTHKGETRQGRRSYRLNISFGPEVNPFRCSRKASAFRPRTKYLPTRAIVDVVSVGNKACQCISVDAPDHLYVTDDCIVTHNTIQAIGASNMDPNARRILVICPASLKINWAREWAKWCVKGLRVATVANGKPESWPASADVVIINYDLVGKHGDRIFAQGWDMLIVDEAHNLKNPKAKRTKNILGLRARDGGWEEPPIPAKRLLLLTGTAIVNRPIELWTLVSSVNPSRFNSFFAFAKRYCDAKNDGYSWNFNGSSNLAELHAELRANCMVRRKKADVLTELPAKTRQIVAVDCAAAVRKESKTREKLTRRLIELEAAKLLAFLGDDRDAYTYAVEDLKVAQAAAFTEMAKLRHATALAKLPEVISLVREALEQGKVLLFAHHADVVDALAAEFGASAVVIDGRTPQEKRQAAVDRFQTDDSCVVCIASIQAAGVGLTLTASSHVIFAELDWVPGNMTQAEDRVHRIGQKENVLVWHIVADGSIDAHMAKTIVRKQRVIDSALDAGAVAPIRADLPEANADAEELSTVSAVIPEFVTISRAEINAWLAQEDAGRVGATVARATERAAERGFGKEAAEMTPAQIEAVRVNLGALVSVCDGAVENDAMGFNGVDAKVGHALARLAELEPLQAAYARALLGKYKRQLGADAIAAMSA